MPAHWLDPCPASQQGWELPPMEKVDLSALQAPRYLLAENLHQ